MTYIENLPSLFDFKYIYAIIVVRANADNTINIKDIENENGTFFNKLGEWYKMLELEETIKKLQELNIKLKELGESLWHS